MSGKSKQPDDRLMTLRDELAADVMNTTDDEILEETKARGVDPVAAAARVGSIVQRAVLSSGKKKMAAARAGMREHTQVKSRAVVDIKRGPAALDAAAKKNPALHQRLTLAARNGEALSDRDVETLVDDLLELGILKEDDLK